MNFKKPVWPGYKAIQKATFPESSLIPWTEGWFWGVFVKIDPETYDKKNKFHLKIGKLTCEIVAFATMRPSAQFSDAAYMTRCGVRKEWRGNGLQHRLIKARVAYARKQGYNFVVTDTTENPRSANNLIKEGFLTYLPERPYGYRETIYWLKRTKKDTK